MAKRSKMMRIKEVENDSRLIAGYVRVSTDRQAEEGYSIDVQKERLTAYIKAVHGNDTKFELYIDDGYSGSTTDRPAMLRLIEDVEQQKISQVVVCKLDRLSRSQKDTIHLMEDVFIANNTSFVSINESFDSATPFGRAVVGILSVFAQLERENIFERTRSGMRKRVESGLWPGGGIVPFGYDYDPVQGILVPNKDADTVRTIYRLYMEGYSCQHIADKLNLKYDKIVQQILTRKSNAGYIVYNGEEFVGKHQPLISLETYEKAMMMYKERSAKRLVTKSHHLLAGLVYCGKCGAKMRYQIWGNKGYKLLCYSQQTNKKYLIKDANCDNARPWADEIENIVVQDLFEMTHDMSLKLQQTGTEVRGALDILLEQQSRTETKLQRLYTLFAEDADAVLIKTIAEVKNELDAVQRKIAEEKDHAATTRVLQKNYEYIETLEDGWSAMTVHEQRQAICSVVESIIVTDNNVHINYQI